MDPAVVVAGIAAVLSAAVHGWIFVLEALRWERPSTRRVFGTSAEHAAESKQLAANQGVYNLLLGVGALVGVVVLISGATDAGLAVVLTTTGIMLGAAVYLGASAPKLARAALVQGVPPAVAVVAAVVALAA